MNLKLFAKDSSNFRKVVHPEVKGWENVWKRNRQRRVDMLRRETEL